MDYELNSRALPLLPLYRRPDVYALIARYLHEDGHDDAAQHVLRCALSVGIQPTDLSNLTQVHLSTHMGSMINQLMHQPSAEMNGLRGMLEADGSLHDLLSAPSGAAPGGVPGAHAPGPSNQQAMEAMRMPGHQVVGAMLGAGPGPGPVDMAQGPPTYQMAVIVNMHESGVPGPSGLVSASATPYQPMSPLPELPAPSPELAPQDLQRMSDHQVQPAQQVSGGGGQVSLLGTQQQQSHAHAGSQGRGAAEGLNGTGMGDLSGGVHRANSTATGGSLHGGAGSQHSGGGAGQAASMHGGPSASLCLTRPAPTSPNVSHGMQHSISVASMGGPGPHGAAGGTDAGLMGAHPSNSGRGGTVGSHGGSGHLHPPHHHPQELDLGSRMLGSHNQGLQHISLHHSLHMPHMMHASAAQQQALQQQELNDLEARLQHVAMQQQALEQAHSSLGSNAAHSQQHPHPGALHHPHQGPPPHMHHHHHHMHMPPPLDVAPLGMHSNNMMANNPADEGGTILDIINDDDDDDDGDDLDELETSMAGPDQHMHHLHHMASDGGAAGQLGPAGRMGMQEGSVGDEVDAIPEGEEEAEIGGEDLHLQPLDTSRSGAEGGSLDGGAKGGVGGSGDEEGDGNGPHSHRRRHDALGSPADLMTAGVLTPGLDYGSSPLDDEEGDIGGGAGTADCEEGGDEAPQGEGSCGRAAGVGSGSGSGTGRGSEDGDGRDDSDGDVSHRDSGRRRSGDSGDGSGPSRNRSTRSPRSPPLYPQEGGDVGEVMRAPQATGVGTRAAQAHLSVRGDLRRDRPQGRSGDGPTRAPYSSALARGRDHGPHADRSGWREEEDRRRRERERDDRGTAHHPRGRGGGPHPGEGRRGAGGWEVDRERGRPQDADHYRGRGGGPGRDRGRSPRAFDRNMPERPPSRQDRSPLRAGNGVRRIGSSSELRPPPRLMPSRTSGGLDLQQDVPAQGRRQGPSPVSSSQKRGRDVSLPDPTAGEETQDQRRVRSRRTSRSREQEGRDGGDWERGRVQGSAEWDRRDGRERERGVEQSDTGRQQPARARGSGERSPRSPAGPDTRAGPHLTSNGQNGGAGGLSKPRRPDSASAQPHSEGVRRRSPAPARSPELLASNRQASGPSNLLQGNGNAPSAAAAMLPPPPAGLPRAASRGHTPDGPLPPPPTQHQGPPPEAVVARKRPPIFMNGHAPAPNPAADPADRPTERRQGPAMRSGLDGKGHLGYAKLRPDMGREGSDTLPRGGGPRVDGDMGRRGREVASTHSPARGGPVRVNEREKEWQRENQRARERADRDRDERGYRGPPADGWRANRDKRPRS